GGRGTRELLARAREEFVGELEGLRLHVLWEGQRHCTGLGLVDEHPHRLERGGDELLGPRDPVEVAGDGLQRIVNRDVSAPRHLELLQHRIGPTGREDIARNQEHGKPVHRRERGTGDEVRRSGPNGGRARERPEPVLHARVARCRVHHRLLIARLVVGQKLRALIERLADSGDVAVTEDPEAAPEELVLEAVPFDVLGGQEADERLRGRELHYTSARIASSSCSSSASSRPPAMRRTSSCRSISRLSYVPRLWPRLRITKRSPTGYAECRVCLMKMTGTPRSRAWRTYFRTTPACLTPRAEVGSSRMSTRAPK